VGNIATLRSVPPPPATAIELASVAATIAVDVASIVERYQAEISGLQSKLSATRESLLRARTLQRDSIQELRRVGSDQWLGRAAEEIAGAVGLATQSEISPLWIADIMKRHRDGPI
jgi:Flp pilus assembly pilin Flp